MATVKHSIGRKLLKGSTLLSAVAVLDILLPAYSLAGAIYSDNFALNGTDRTAGAPLAGTSPGGAGSSATWTANPYAYQFTFGAAGGILPKTADGHGEANLPVTLGAGTYDLSANLFTDNSQGDWLAITFSNDNDQYPEYQAPLWMLIEGNGTYGVFATVHDSGFSTSIGSGTVSTASWSSATPPKAELIWNTVAQTATAEINGQAVLSNYSLSAGFPGLAEDVNYVGFGQDGPYPSGTGPDAIITNFALSEVPEPSTLCLIGLGAGSLLMRRRSRRFPSNGGTGLRGNP